MIIKEIFFASDFPITISMFIHENFISQRITKRRVSNVKSNKQSLFENVRLIQTSTKWKKVLRKNVLDKSSLQTDLCLNKRNKKTEHCETYLL